MSALRTAALYPAAVRIAPPLCHPGSEWRMLCVEVSGHCLGVAVYHYRAVPYMTAVAVAWTQQSSNSMPWPIVTDRT